VATLRNALKNTESKLHQHMAYSLEEAKLEARFILEYVLKISQKEIIQENDRLLNEEDQLQIETITEKRIAGTPLPYILGEWSFYGRTFKVNRNVLIPRADTEILIEKVLSKISKRDTFHILDLGCGTGIIGITLALERPLSKVMLIDQSEDALKNTKENLALHQAPNITIQKSDWFDALTETKFDLIVSNPPYLEVNDPHLLEDLKHEPMSALISGPTGTTAVAHIIEYAKNHMNQDAWLFIEHGYNQAEIVRDLFLKNGYQHIEHAKDIHGIHRVTVGQYSIV
jgi:release factor glutamine methyltransferase